MALKNLLNGTEITIMCNFKSIEQINICVVGLGYVGLPLAVEFGKKYRTIGFDLNKVRIKNLLSGIDETKEVDKADLRAATHLSYTSKDSDIAGCNVYIVTVPTPIDQSNRPDLSPLISASRKLGGLINIGDLVIYNRLFIQVLQKKIVFQYLRNILALNLTRIFLWVTVQSALTLVIKNTD